MSIEEWKDVVEYEGYYQVSNLGRVKSLERRIKRFNGKFSSLRKEKILVGSIQKNGYIKFNFYKNRRYKKFYLHRLVFNTFIGNIPNKMCVCHNDGDPNNNNLLNLRLDTYKGNSDDKIKHKTKLIGEKVSSSKLKDCEVWLIKKLLFCKIKQKQIAKMFNVSPQTICDIKNKRCWNHIFFINDNERRKIKE